MPHKELLDKSEALRTLMMLLSKCFSEYGVLVKFPHFFTELPVKPDLIKITAYRVVVLSPDLEERPDTYPPQMSQLDWAKLAEPYQSWSLTYEGAKRYLSGWGSNNYHVLVKALVEGFILAHYADKVICHVEELLHTEAKFFEEESAVKLQLVNGMAYLKGRANNFQDEQEIVPTKEVSGFEFIT